MRKGVYAKLAVTNIKKNRSTYIPYMLTCIVCIAMLYMMFFIYGNEGMQKLPGGPNVMLIMALGIGVIAIFSVVFLLYCNSYVMKRRQKEIGLYNILGMEKGHIAKMMLIETLLTSMISLVLGIALGILGSKLALLLLLKLLHLPALFGFYVYGSGIARCWLLFGGIFFLTLLTNLRRVHVSRPIELLRGSSAGEREPKAKLFMAILGFISLGAGYYIAITTKSPMEALMLFFLAVILVMIGTYLLFTSGSIVILKIMRWKKSFYYKTKNFTSVSGMLYRMKQNAVGLSNICILSTGVLLMLSSTVSLNYGMKEIMEAQYPNDMTFTIYGEDLKEAQYAQTAAKQVVEDNQVSVTEQVEYTFLSAACLEENGVYSFEKPDAGMTTIMEYHNLVLIPQESYEALTGEKPGLMDGEVLLYREKGALEGNVQVMGSEFQIVKNLDAWPLPEDPDPFLQDNNTALIVTVNDFNKIDALQREAYEESIISRPESVLGIDIEGTAEEKIACAHKLDDEVLAFAKEELSEEAWYRLDIREEEYQNAYTLYGGFLFLGIFLGGLFLIGTAMLIYYKQMSEGYEDKARFEIMRKVGMSKREVKSSIRRQILMVFFLPLLMAVIHIAAAFPLVNRLLIMFALDNTALFTLCTIVTIVIFAVVYGIIYLLTAKAYYRILEKAE